MDPTKQSFKGVPPTSRSWVVFGGVCLCLIFSLCGTTASAQSPLSADEVAQLAREQAPAIRLANAQARRAEARAAATGLWPNPSIEFERSQTFEGGDRSEDTVSLELPLISGRQAASRSIAAVDSSRADLARDVICAATVADAVRLFYQVLAAQRGVAILRDAQGQLDDAQRVLESREAAGETSGYASARLALEVELARSQLAEAEVEAEVMRTDMLKTAPGTVHLQKGKRVLD